MASFFSSVRTSRSEPCYLGELIRLLQREWVVGYRESVLSVGANADHLLCVIALR